MIKALLVLLVISYLPNVVFSSNIATILVDLRKVYKGPITITSNLRNRYINRRFRGNKNSKHICGKAIDIRIWGLTKKNIHDILQLDRDRYDVVVEGNHIHIELEENCND